jgi:hypothetical protein
VLELLHIFFFSFFGHTYNEFIILNCEKCGLVPAVVHSKNELTFDKWKKIHRFQYLVVTVSSAYCLELYNKDTNLLIGLVLNPTLPEVLFFLLTIFSLILYSIAHG